MASITIILGAGASCEFVKDSKLTSAFIMQKLLNADAWHNLFANHYNGSQVIPDIENIMKLINENRKESDNFEDLIEIIDKVCTLLNPHKFSDALLIRSVNYITDQLLENSFDRDDLVNLPLYIRELIAEIIKEYNNALGKESESQKLIDLQREFIRHLLDKCNNVSVHSLNYDDCILTSLEPLGFCSGFDDSGYFQKSEYQSSNKVISYLHGTPHFVPKFKYFSGNSAIVRYYKNSEEASKERWRLSAKHLGLYTDGIVHPDYNYCITTGHSKDIHFYNQPYATYYTRLAEDLDNADLIFIIGYSFGDEHINQLLSSIRGHEQPKSVVIVDFDNPDEKNYEKKAQEKIARIIITLEKQYAEIATNIPFQNILSQLLDRKFAKIGCNDIYYYNHGYASFLKEDINNLIFNEFATFLALNNTIS